MDRTEYERLGFCRTEYERGDAYARRDLRTARVLSDEQWRAFVARLTGTTTTED